MTILKTVPERVEDEAAALRQFATELKSRHEEAPQFSSKPLGEAIEEAFGGPSMTRKALGSNFICLYVF